MGVILDSSIVITAERRGDTVTQLLKRVSAASSDQEAALSSIGLTELIHGIYRANTAGQRSKREAFIYELLDYIPVHSFTKETALLAGKIDGEQQKKGVVIPIADLLIAATALSIGYSLVTGNIRHFRQIPGLSLLPL
jgi:tRNA(fMet)-specific endonuclease VapC